MASTKSSDTVGVSGPVTLANPSDLTLIVGPSGQSIHVCRGALCLASPVWNKMFSGEWTESTKKEVNFPDDDPEALLIVLGIAHLKFKGRPNTLRFGQLVQLAVICDKYDTVGVVRPFLTQWIDAQQMKVAPGMEEWIFIAWTFGYKQQFIDGVQYLVRNTMADQNGRLFLQWQIGDILKTQYIDVRLPLDILDCITRARRDSISKLIETAFNHLEKCVSAKECFQYAQRFSPNYVPPKGSEKNFVDFSKCIANTTGHLLKGLHGVGIWPRKPDASTYRSSFDLLHEQITQINIPAYNHCHSTCAGNLAAESMNPVNNITFLFKPLVGEVESLRRDIDALNKSLFLGYQQHHLKHIEIQAAK